MSFLKMLYYPDKRLRLIAKPVIKIDKNIKNIAKEMINIMIQQEGIGLAATQVNVQLQIIVIHHTKRKKNHLVLINPTILKKKGTISIEEGCLSIPGYRAYIPRSKYITVQFLNLDGIQIEIETESIISVCIQHEIDHLKGKLFIDYLSTLKQERIYKKFQKIKKLQQYKIGEQ